MSSCRIEFRVGRNLLEFGVTFDAAKDDCYIEIWFPNTLVAFRKSESLQDVEKRKQFPARVLRNAIVKMGNLLIVFMYRRFSFLTVGDDSED